MVQEFCVLKCYSCGMFQVHIVKKAKTWHCKICNSKQSIVKVFGQGNAKDCRMHVQKLNELHENRNDVESGACSKETSEIAHNSGSLIRDDDFSSLVQCNSTSKRKHGDDDCNISKKSKWNCYLVDEKMNSYVEKNTLENNNVKTENSFSCTRTKTKSKWDNYLEETKSDISLKKTLKESYNNKSKNSPLTKRNCIENHSQNSFEPFEKIPETIKLEVKSNNRIMDENKVFNLFNFEHEEVDDFLNV